MSSPENRYDRDCGLRKSKSALSDCTREPAAVGRRSTARARASCGEEPSSGRFSRYRERFARVAAYEASFLPLVDSRLLERSEPAVASLASPSPGLLLEELLRGRDVRLLERFFPSLEDTEDASSRPELSLLFDLTEPGEVAGLVEDEDAEPPCGEK